MSQKENLAPYSYYNYPFPSQSTTTGNNNLSPTILSENTCANTVYANDGLSLPTSHCIRMLKQKYQRKDKENQTKNKLFTNSRNNNQNWSAKNTGECLSLGGDDENCLGQLPETKNNDVPLQLPTLKNPTIRDEEFAAYREALLKQATLESQTLSSAQMEQLCQQQLLFQGELRKTQDDLKTLEEILKEAQYDRSQRDKDIQDSLQRSENEVT